MFEILEYLDQAGDSPSAAWFARLDAVAAAKIATAILRLQQGNLSAAKTVGGGLIEYRINFGPGYRLYFGRDGDTLIVLLGGGTKKGQQQDIGKAHLRWQDYKRRKRALKET